MTIRWKRLPKPTGLAAVAAFPRQSYLTDLETGKMYMSVYPEDRSGSTWRWSIIRPGGNRRSIATYPDHDSAKKAATEHWKKNREAIIKALDDGRQ